MVDGCKHGNMASGEKGRITCCKLLMEVRLACKECIAVNMRIPQRGAFKLFNEMQTFHQNVTAKKEMKGTRCIAIADVDI